jgi:thiol-disulfide isomerase/thioredoxin
LKKEIMKKFLTTGMIALFVLVSQFRVEADEFFPEFTSSTLSGETVTNDIFSGKRLTMVNIWATWCGPCISEMPDLGRLAKIMPENTQLVGIIEDALYNSDATEIAKEIVNYADADFPQIIAVESMISCLAKVEYIPTTIFVDQDGRIVGEPLVGSRYAESYLAAVESILGETALDSYAITVSNNITGGVVTLNKTTAAVGESVSFVYTPDSGYELGSITAYKTGDTSMNIPLACTSNVCEFVMPGYPVTIEASFRTSANSNVNYNKENSDGGGGGCNALGGAFAALALGAAALATRKRGQKG